jgi:DNA repair protein RAD5
LFVSSIPKDLVRNLINICISDIRTTYYIVEVGRLPNHVASWVSKLLDINIINLAGTVVDCPKPLRTGNNVVLSLRAYMLPAAFRKPRQMLDDNEHKTWWDEGKQTADEKILSERKESLLRLFDTVSLRPVRTSQASRADNVGDLETGACTVKMKGKGKAAEVIGDDEDAEEVELEGEELDDQQISLIYKK